VEDIHFVKGKQVNVLLDEANGEEMPANVEVKSAVFECRLVVDNNKRYCPLNAVPDCFALNSNRQ
jgi:hypothetical protein